LFLLNHIQKPTCTTIDADKHSCAFFDFNKIIFGATRLNILGRDGHTPSAKIVLNIHIAQLIMGNNTLMHLSLHTQHYYLFIHSISSLNTLV
jgi:hypothetical protein